jgi:hypothetical protein
MLLLHRIASGEVVPPQHAGPLASVLMRLLDPDPARRPTMEQARIALAEIADGREATATMPVPVVPPDAPAPPPDTSPRRSRTPALIALAALFVVVAVATTLLVLDRDNAPQRDNAGAPAAANTSTSARPTTSANPTTTTQAEPAEPTEPAEETEQPSAPPETPSRPKSQAPPPAADPTANPVTAVTDYYRIMPGNPDVGWTRLSPKFQQSPANGRDYYESYWSGINSVRASQASGQGSTVEVTLDIFFKDGRVAHERHRYGLVNQNGRWLIDTVDVLSSTIS